MADQLPKIRTLGRQRLCLSPLLKSGASCIEGGRLPPAGDAQAPEHTVAGGTPSPTFRPPIDQASNEDLPLRKAQPFRTSGGEAAEQMDC